MSADQIVAVDVLDSFESLIGKRLEPLDEESGTRRFEYEGEEGILGFRKRGGDDVASISIWVTDPLPPNDMTFRYVANHAYASDALGTLQASVAGGVVAVRAAHAVPLHDCTEAHLGKVLEGLVDRARKARGEMPLCGYPFDVDPASAWLVMGDDHSFMTDEDLNEALDALNDRGIFICRWTASKKVRFGDLVLIYYRAPRKAVHFVARAARDAYFDSDSDVGAATPVADAQWWVDLTPPIRIDPIDFATLKDVAAGHLNLKGQSGKYLRPEAIKALTFTAARPEDQEELDWVTTTPVGHPDLPDAGTMTMDQWRALASGALEREEHVCQYIVEPLVRMAAPSFTLHPQVKLAGGATPDFLVRNEGGVDRCVIEVKQVIEIMKGQPVESSKAFAQLRRYQMALDLPGALIDANQVVLVALDGSIVRQSLRDDFSDRSLEALGRHLTGGQI